MSTGRIVEFYEISKSKSLLDEIEAELTTVQLERFRRNVKRLEQYGWHLDGSFFDNVAGAKEKLREYRTTLDKVEFRVLFSEEPGGIFVMLVCYKEKSGGIPDSKIAAAEERLAKWRKDRAAKAKAAAGIQLPGKQSK